MKVQENKFHQQMNNGKVLMSNLMLNYYLKKNRKQDSIPMSNESMLERHAHKIDQNCNLVFQNKLERH